MLLETTKNKGGCTIEHKNTVSLTVSPFSWDSGGGAASIAFAATSSWRASSPALSAAALPALDAEAGDSVPSLLGSERNIGTSMSRSGKQVLLGSGSGEDDDDDSDGSQVVVVGVKRARFSLVSACALLPELATGNKAHKLEIARRCWKYVNFSLSPPPNTFRNPSRRQGRAGRCLRSDYRATLFVRRRRRAFGPVSRGSKTVLLGPRNEASRGVERQETCLRASFRFRYPQGPPALPLRPNVCTRRRRHGRVSSRLMLRTRSLGKERHNSRRSCRRRVGLHREVHIPPSLLSPDGKCS